MTIQIHLKYTFLSGFFAKCDTPEPFQLGMQDSGTENMEWLINLHNYVMSDLIIVLAVIIGLLAGFFSQKYGINLNFTKSKLILVSNKKFSHSKFLEIFWTVIPAFILLVIASPTFNLLYALDDLADPGLILKITAHQWYWSYEYVLSLDDIINFDSYLIKTEDLNFGSLRLLETTKRLELPYRTHVRLLITSADVLHSWTIPSFGIKVDACPGRLTQASIFIKRAGLYFGQCSELCGVNHGFMPIVVKSVIPNILLESKTNIPLSLSIPVVTPLVEQVTSAIDPVGSQYNIGGIMFFIGLSLIFISSPVAIVPVLVVAGASYVTFEAGISIEPSGGHCNLNIGKDFDSSDSSVTSAVEPLASEVLQPSLPEVVKPVVSEVLQPSLPEVVKPVVSEVLQPSLPEVVKPSLVETPTKSSINLNHIPTGIDYLNDLTGGSNEFKSSDPDDVSREERIRSALIDIASDMRTFHEFGMDMETPRPIEGFYVSQNQIRYISPDGIDTVVVNGERPDKLCIPSHFGNLLAPWVTDDAIQSSQNFIEKENIRGEVKEDVVQSPPVSNVQAVVSESTSSIVEETLEQKERSKKKQKLSEFLREKKNLRKKKY